ncbi:MAG: hypothetical protein HY619_05295 [Thaumarchaeota archaeon]|nr:hypothetical protein [Nitrososphaerota archaeon]
MSFTEEEVKRAAELKQWAQGRIAELEAEMEKLRETLFVVDTVLRKTSFKAASELRAATPEQATPPPAPSPPKVAAEEFKEVRPIKRSSDGKLLANTYIAEAEAAIVPASDVRLSASTPPFKTFFVNRIIDGMKDKDQQEVSRGALRGDQAIDFQLAEENGSISKIIIKNYRDKNRLNEIINSVAWTFARMLEKKP